MREPTRRYYEFGPFRLDVAKRQLLRDGRAVPLIAKAFDTLLALVENRGRVIEKEELLKLVWPDSFVEESNLSQNVFVLRKALGEGPHDHRYIVTVPRRGYRFVADVREVADEGAAPAVMKPDRRLAPDSQPVVKTIAVLPFKPLGPSEDDDCLGLGVADALITQLSNLRQIITRPTSAVLKYAASGSDRLAAGRELGVDCLLDGHLQKLRDRIRLTVQLVNVADSAPLWADKFDAHLTDIFTVQDSISEQVARALMLKLTAAEQRRLVRHYTQSIEAYELYLKGRYHVAKFTGESLPKAIGFFQEALAIDPAYALAYAGLADAYFHAATFYLPPKEALSLMKEAAQQAVERDDLLAEAHTMLAAARMNLDWDWAGAEQGFKRAIELNPGHAAAHHWYGWYLVLMGRHDESIAELRQAQRLDPLSLTVNLFLSSAYYFARRYDEALGQCRKLLEIEPNFWVGLWVLGGCYERQGRWPEAFAALDRARALDDSPVIQAALGVCYATAGRRSEARQILDGLRQLSAHRFVSPYYLALAYAALGETAQAFEYLAKACDDRDESAPLVKVDPRLDSLRSDSRFADLLRRAGLAP